MALETAILTKFDLDSDKTLSNTQKVTEIRCLRCNRRLSHPDSIARGMGAWCARTVAYETRRSQETPSYTFTPRTKIYFSRKDQKVQQAWSFHPDVESGQSSNGFGGLKPIESVEDRFHWPDLDVIANLLIPDCCCCERVLVRGQLAELVSNTLGKDVFFCRDCYAKECDPRSNRCNFEHMTRPSPLTEFMSLVTS